jgi:hypothetical protein
MKRLEEMHMLAEALDKRTFGSLLFPLSSLMQPRWHGTRRVHTCSQGPDSKSLGPRTAVVL